MCVLQFCEEAPWHGLPPCSGRGFVQVLVWIPGTPGGSGVHDLLQPDQYVQPPWTGGGCMQQSVLDAALELKVRQFLEPHTRFPRHCASLSQSPPPSMQGLLVVQQFHWFDNPAQAGLIQQSVPEAA